jgi:hypothetical protein
MKSRSLDTYLKSAKDLDRLVAHAESLLRIQRIYVKIAPDYLAEASQVANYKLGKVVIHAANGAVAAKLRQLEPSLRGALSSSGVEVTEISVKVQAALIDTGPARRKSERGISPAGLGQISALAAQIPDDSPLRPALQRLLDKSRHGGQDTLEK